MEQNEQANIELFKTAIDAGKNALKAAFILNGGASIAAFAFIGRIIDVHPDRVLAFGVALFCFAMGVFAITLACGFTYLVQLNYYKYHGSKKAEAVATGNFWTLICILLTSFSYLAFFVGLIIASCGLYQFIAI